jgi:16S rRNA (uracil1498-N3)-methyltransferase
MPKFFIAATNLIGGMAYMRGNDAHHLRVLRLKPGDNVIVCDGRGNDYSCRIVTSTDQEAQLEILESHICKSEPSISVSVFCGLPKGSDRTEYIIQKSVESGAAKIYFFNSRFTVAKLIDQQKKLERWNAISKEAAKQCGRGILPEVTWAGDYTEMLNFANKAETKLFMYEKGDNRIPLKEVLKSNSNSKSFSIITGPEGGFAEFESDIARKLGFFVCSMGERVLRCETAPIIAITSVMFATGNL